MAIDLVTGASGLVGGNLVRELVNRGRKVRILVRKNSKTCHLDDLEGIEKVEGDVTDRKSLELAFQGVKDVYHCAAMVSMWAQHEEQMYRVNVDGTRNVIWASLQASIRRLVYCSSVDAIGLPTNGIPSKENSEWNWDQLGLDNPYARTKYAAQKLVLDVSKSLLDSIVVNPTFMFGAYDTRPSSGQMIIAIANGKMLGYPQGGNNFVFVNDVVNGMIAAADRANSGDAFILGNSNMTYKQIFSKISNVLNIKPPRFAIPYAVARFGGALGDLFSTITSLEPDVTTITAKMAYVDHYYDPGKAVRELDMQQTPIDVAIEHAVRWFRDKKIL